MGSHTRTITECNRLPPDIRQIKIEASFKLALRTYFNDRQFTNND